MIVLDNESFETNNELLMSLLEFAFAFSLRAADHHGPKGPGRHLRHLRHPPFLEPRLAVHAPLSGADRDLLELCHCAT